MEVGREQVEQLKQRNKASRMQNGGRQRTKVANKAEKRSFEDAK
jgi:hypothetical protein